MSGEPSSGASGAPPPASRADELAAALAVLEARLRTACRVAGRRRSSVTVVAVTKFHPVQDVVALHRLGVRDLGESRDQEASTKAAELSGLSDLRWHFVGGLQRNKARSVATYASLVHSLDSVRLADALADGAERAGRRLPVLLQVSLDGDPQRSGVAAGDLAPLAAHVAGLPGLRLRGLMAVAPMGAEPARAFGDLAELAAGLRNDHPDADLLSAGMSGDLEPAVAAGSTHVRVGTALLGPRPAPAR